MISVVSPQLENYAVEHSRSVPELMEELRAYTYRHTDLPQMQVGPLEGNFLKLLVRATGAKRVLEVGTFTGYSALMMASGLPPDGHLITCELDEGNAAIARRFFDKSPFGSKITIERGPAAQSIARMKGPFDMAFIDADKENYIVYFDMIRPLMRPSGLIAIDNVLWSGHVLEPESDQSPSTRAICAFNRHLKNLTELDKIMVTLRDGITLVVT